MTGKTPLRVVPKLRFPEFESAPAWECPPLKKLATRVTQRNTQDQDLRPLTNSAEHGVVDQREYFDKDIATTTDIGLPANLFYSTGIPVCILVLKKCKKPDDVLFINAAEHFEKGKRQNYLSDEHIQKIIDTYQQRPENIERYARRVGMDEIEDNDFNLNISRYVSTAEAEVQIDLAATHKELVEIEKQIQESTLKHNEFLKELGLAPLPGAGQ